MSLEKETMKRRRKLIKKVVGYSVVTEKNKDKWVAVILEEGLQTKVGEGIRVMLAFETLKLRQDIKKTQDEKKRKKLEEKLKLYNYVLKNSSYNKENWKTQIKKSDEEKGKSDTHYLRPDTWQRRKASKYEDPQRWDKYFRKADPSVDEHITWKSYLVLKEKFIKKFGEEKWNEKYPL